MFCPSKVHEELNRLSSRAFPLNIPESPVPPLKSVNHRPTARDLFTSGIITNVSDVIAMLDAACTKPNKIVRVPTITMYSN